MRMFTIALLCTVLTATSVVAKPHLRDVAEIDDALLDLGIADIIRKKCPTISARMFKAIGYVTSLERRAKALGYSAAEIKAYTDSDAEKARMRKRGAKFFASKGVDTSDPQSYCALGQAEIKNSSRIGSLLKAR